MKPTIVILTTNFGTNFSGGATSTSEIFTRIQDDFKRIIVLGNRVGEHTIKNLVFFRTYNWLQTLILLYRLKGRGFLFYGDFYNSFLLAMAGVPYVFTYHDNWPELAQLNFRHRILNIYYSAAYRLVFQRAKQLVTVSAFKRKQLEKYSSSVTVIPNGFYHSANEDKQNESDRRSENRIVMVGNIDERKYLLAIRLFNKLDPSLPVQIDIYGHEVDPPLARKLEQFPFVRLKGFVKEVPYQEYALLLHTSFTESFGIIFCEAISRSVPVLTFDHGGARELINTQNGKMVRSHRVDRLKDALIEMIRKPMTADPTTVQQYSWENTSKQYQKLFQDVG